MQVHRAYAYCTLLVSQMTAKRLMHPGEIETLQLFSWFSDSETADETAFR